MGNSDKQRSQQLLNEFSNRLAKVNVPPLRISETLDLNFTIPKLDSAGRGIDDQLLDSAQLRFGRKNVKVALSRSGDTVNVRLAKKF